MRIEKLISILLLSLVCSCSVEPLGVVNQQSSTGVSEVFVAVGDGATRLAISCDGESSATVRWEDDDAIYLWAQGESGQMAFESAQFNVKYYGEEYSTAIFTAQVSSMDEGSYTYWGSYPEPEEVSTDSVKYTLPSVQSGVYGENGEVMAMHKSEGVALTGDINRDMVMNFEHLTHLMRIEIPSEGNLLGEDLASLTIEFPRAVVGEGWLDFDDEELSYELVGSVEGDSTIVVNFPESYAAGGDYIWVTLAAGEMAGDIIFSAVSESGLVSQRDTIHSVDRLMAAGRITPLTITVPQEDQTYSTFTIKVDHSNLGEEINTITLSAPSGCYFKGEVGETGKITLSVADGVSAPFAIHEDYISAFNSGSISVEYDSDNAEVSGTLSGSGVVAGGAELSATAPYLFEEDFSTFTASSTVTSHAQISSTDWYRERAQVYVGAISIQPYNDRSGILSYTYERYMGKLTSPPLSNLKSGAEVDINVSFGADWSANKFSSMSMDVGLSATTGAVDDAMTSVSNFSMTNSSAGSTTTSLTARSVDISGATAVHRISWKSNSSSSSGSDGTDNIYMRNIKVSIK